MEFLCNVLFEVSNEDRLRILHLLHHERLNVTQIARILDLSSQEASRHLARLSKTGLTLKTGDGKYQLTGYGTVLLTQLDGIDFTAQHQPYFLGHTLARLPRAFLHRIGELAASTYLDDLMVVFTNIERVIRDAEEYLWVITDQYLPSNLRLHLAAYERGVHERDIELKSWIVPQRIKERLRDAEDLAQGIRQARATNVLQERMVERLDVYLVMSEQEVAVVAFPLPDGRFDYRGFSATDAHAHTWCRDLFDYYWEQAYPRLKLAEELFWWLKHQPRATRVFRQLAQGDTVEHPATLSQLEQRFLIKDGQLTILGDHVYHRLVQS